MGNFKASFLSFSSKITLASALLQQLTSLVPSGAAFFFFLVVQAQFSDFKSNLPRNLQTNLQAEASKLLAAVANCSEQVVNQNTNVAAEVCRVARKRTSGLTVIQTPGQNLHFLAH